MADITYTIRATNRSDAVDAVIGKGDSGTLKKFINRTFEVTSRTQNDTIFFGRIPSNARISGFSRVRWDDLATSGSPTLDIGLASVGSNITSDADALSNGHDIATATTGGADVVGEIANIGKRAWEFVNGQTTDPGGQLDVYGSFVDAATNQTGTLVIEVSGYLD